VLRPIFENLGKLNLSRDQLLAEAEQGITALVERANLAVAPTNDGADIDAAIAAARDKLPVVDTRAAREALSRRSGLDNPQLRRLLSVHGFHIGRDIGHPILVKQLASNMRLN